QIGGPIGAATVERESGDFLPNGPRGPSPLAALRAAERRRERLLLFLEATARLTCRSSLGDGGEHRPEGPRGASRLPPRGRPGAGGGGGGATGCPKRFFPARAVVTDLSIIPWRRR